MLNHFSKISKATKRDFDWGPHPVWLETYLAISHPILGLRALIVHGKKTSAQFDEWNILTEIHGIYIYIWIYGFWMLKRMRKNTTIIRRFTGLHSCWFTHQTKWWYGGWASEILRHQKDGWNPSKIMGCLPPINWWFGFRWPIHSISCSKLLPSGKHTV